MCAYVRACANTRGHMCEQAHAYAGVQECVLVVEDGEHSRTEWWRGALCYHSRDGHPGKPKQEAVAGQLPLQVELESDACCGTDTLLKQLCLGTPLAVLRWGGKETTPMRLTRARCSTSQPV